MTPHDDATVTYYQDDEADFIHACRGSLAHGGMLRISTPVTTQSHWEWVQRGTGLWDAIHQKIYRNCRATPLQPSGISALPPLPDAATEPARYEDPTSFEAAEFPHLSRFLQAEEHATSQFIVVLGEDTYESSMGDGEFHYLEYLCKNAHDAQAYILSKKQLPDSGYSDYHVRSLSLNLKAAVIHCDLETEVFDHCDLANALKLAEAWAESMGSVAR
jgi:hypothetical protein